MELHEFITATLVDIQRGVQAAIDIAKTQSLKGAINLVWGDTSDIGSSNVQTVTFDVAVTASERLSGEADAGIEVLGIGIGGKAALADENLRVSRIQFSIPVIPPVTTVSPNAV